MSSERQQEIERQEGRPARSQQVLWFALLRRVARQPRLVVAPLLVVLLAVVGISAGTGLFLPKLEGDGVEVAGVQTQGAPAMAAQSMQAMKDLDAQSFWAALDDNMRQSLAAQGVQGPDGVAQMFAQVRATGMTISSYKYIARHDMASGETVSFFVAKRRSPNGQEAEVPFLITTNQKGLVSKLE